MVLYFNRSYLVFNSFQFLYSFISLVRIISSKPRYQYGESKENLTEKKMMLSIAIKGALCHSPLWSTFFFTLFFGKL